MKKDVFYAFLGGALLGGVAALLFAPESGEETRKKISNAAKKEKEKLMDAFETVKEEYEKKKGEVIEAIESAKSKYSATKGEMSAEIMDAIECAKKEYDEVGKKLSKAMKTR